MQSESEKKATEWSFATVVPPKPEWSAPKAGFHGMEVTRNAFGGLNDGFGACAS